VTARLARWVLRSYPPSFRERYGDELAAVVADVGPTAKTVVDLVAGSVQAWLRPSIAGADAERRRRRMQASVSTTWVALLAGFLVAPAVDRALFDGPGPIPGATSTVHSLVVAAEIVIGGGALLGLAGALLVGVPVVTHAMKGRDRRPLRPLALPVALAIVELILTAAVAWVRSGHPASWPQPSIAFVITALVWALVGAALVISSGLGPVVALGRAAPGAELLRLSAVLCLPVAAALALGTALCVIAVGIVGAFSLFTIPVLVVAAAASAVGMTSAWRGLLPALRSHTS
jgi:hypothetical protein